MTLSTEKFVEYANRVESEVGRVIVGQGLNPDGGSEGWVATLAPPVCSNGLDDDGDGAIDLEDVGRGASNDASEHAPQLVCDDGLDEDGDGLADFPDDLGCPFPYAEPENPPCDDGLDNDGDGAVDDADGDCPP